MDIGSLKSLTSGRLAVSRRTGSSSLPAAGGAEGRERAHQPLTYDPALDAVRGISMIAVLAGHVGFLGGAARVGMPLFFALSGFLITRLLVTELETTGGLRLGHFYQRRIRRLAPGLLFMLAIVGLAGMVAAGSLVGAVAYVKNWQVAFNPSPDAVEHTWSLAIEEQFYLLWPLALGLLTFRRLRPAMFALLGLAIASMVWRHGLFVATGDYARAYYGTDTRADAILLGSAAAIAWTRGWRPSRLATWAAAVILVAIALVPAIGHEDFWILVALPVGAVAATVFVVGSVGAGGLMRWRGLVWAGIISYGVYLWHWPLLVALGRPTDIPTMLAISAAAFFMGWLSYRFVEGPVRRWRSHHVPERPLETSVGTVNG